MGASTPMPPRNRPDAGAATGGGQPRTSKHPDGSSLCSTPPRGRKRYALRRQGRAKQWLEWMLVVPPLCMRRGAQRPADQGSRLFERSEFERDPAGREHRRLPQCVALGTQTVGSPSFAFFSWRRKKRRCPAGGTSRHPPSNQACRPISAQAQASTGSARTGGVVLHATLNAPAQECRIALKMIAASAF
ncbi:hypothetical protein CLU86_2743 [Acidovorax sp. 62]|nr:hypothetical protein CLU86_2743 [Acidovorax sp. 62]